MRRLFEGGAYSRVALNRTITVIIFFGKTITTGATIQDSGGVGQPPTKPNNFTFKLVDKLLIQADNIA